MLDLKTAKDYYSRDDVLSTLVKLGENREVIGVYFGGGFGTRPNVVLYPSDITSMIRKGVVEFHTSLERWSNPMSLRADNYESLRTGWDLILDLDCKDFSHAKLAAGILYRTLQSHGLSAISIKYTGGKGFHLGVPWESIPRKVNFKDTLKQFPDLARTIGLYLKHCIREELERGLLKLNNPEELARISGKDLGNISVPDSENKDGSRVIDPFKIVDIDPVLISPRHLFRMPYSLHKGTGLASLPINFKDLSEFEKDHASPGSLRIRKLFLSPGEPEEASALVAETVDWWAIKSKEKKTKPKRTFSSTEKVPEKAFPPCIKNISLGLPDGRKRSIFVLINFLRSCNWTWQEVENYINSWNLKNKPPANENYIRGQIRWARRRKNMPPPNCISEGYYMSFGVCTPDRTCGGSAKTIKNPAAYPLRILDKQSKDKKTASKPKQRKRKEPGPPTQSGLI